MAGITFHVNLYQPNPVRLTCALLGVRPIFRKRP